MPAKESGKGTATPRDGGRQSVLPSSCTGAGTISGPLPRAMLLFRDYDIESMLAG
jgi:hypothetical protein